MHAAIIPAYNPDIELKKLVLEVHENGIDKIIVVNDGSDKQALDFFNQISELAVVINHDINLGKGAAIKTALKYVSDNLTDIQSVVILDADGQHYPKDAIRLLNELNNSCSDLVLGVRSFDGQVPFRSRFGNSLTKYVFRLCSGRWISDTQTGLRAFSANMIPELLNVNGERYEYEMNVLLSCVKSAKVITEVPIATVYHDDSNSCSHFRVVVDSLRIYGNLLAFSGASFISFLLDYSLFYTLVMLLSYKFHEGTALVVGNITARIFSAALNYYINSKYVFNYNHKRLKSFFSYSMLACVILALNTVILYCLNNFGLNRILAKLITEFILFTLSFTIQKFVIFNNSRSETIRS